MKLNGWQRLWVFVSVPIFIVGVVAFVMELVSESQYADPTSPILAAVLWPAFLYAFGWGVAWVRRGFRGP